MTEDNARHKKDEEDLVHAAEQEQGLPHSTRNPPAGGRNPSSMTRRGSMEVSSSRQQWQLNK